MFSNQLEFTFYCENLQKLDLVLLDQLLRTFCDLYVFCQVGEWHMNVQEYDSSNSLDRFIYIHQQCTFALLLLCQTKLLLILWIFQCLECTFDI